MGFGGRGGNGIPGRKLHWPDIRSSDLQPLPGDAAPAGDPKRVYPVAERSDSCTLLPTVLPGSVRTLGSRADLVRLVLLEASEQMELAAIRSSTLDRLHFDDAIFVDDGRSRDTSSHLARTDLATGGAARLGIALGDSGLCVARLAFVAHARGKNSPDPCILFLE